MYSDERLWTDGEGDRWRICMEYTGAAPDDDGSPFVLSWIRETGLGDYVVTPAPLAYALEELSDGDLRALLKAALRDDHTMRASPS